MVDVSLKLLEDVDSVPCSRADGHELTTDRVLTISNRDRSGTRPFHSDEDVACLTQRTWVFRTQPCGRVPVSELRWAGEVRCTHPIPSHVPGRNVLAGHQLYITAERHSRMRAQRPSLSSCSLIAARVRARSASRPSISLLRACRSIDSLSSNVSTYRAMFRLYSFSFTCLTVARWAYRSTCFPTSNVATILSMSCGRNL